MKMSRGKNILPKSGIVVIKSYSHRIWYLEGNPNKVKKFNNSDSEQYFETDEYLKDGLLIIVHKIHKDSNPTTYRHNIPCNITNKVKDSPGILKEVLLREHFENDFQTESTICE